MENERSLEDDIIQELEACARDLGGTIQRMNTSDHTGRTSKKILIEYDIKEKGE